MSGLETSTGLVEKDRMLLVQDDDKAGAAVDRATANDDDGVLRVLIKAPAAPGPRFDSARTERRENISEKYSYV